MNQSITMNLTIEELQSLIENSVRKVIAGISTPPPQPVKPEIMDVQQAADLLRVKPATVYGYVFYKKIPHLKKSGKLLFCRTELLDWLQTGHHVTGKEIELAINENFSK